MAREKRPQNPGNRQQLDYYEYKRRHEEHLRRVNPEMAKAVQASVAQLDEEHTARQKPGKKNVLEGVRQTVTGFGVRPGDEEALDASAALPTAVPPAAEAEALLRAQPVEPAPQEPADDEDAQADEVGAESDNPFSDAAVKLKQLGGKLAGLTGALRQRFGRKQEDEDEAEEADEVQPSAAQSSDEASTSRRARRAARQDEDAVPANERTADELAQDVLDAPVVQSIPEAKPTPAPQSEPILDAHMPYARPVAAKRSALPEEDEGDESDDEPDEPARKRFSLFGSPSRAAANHDDDEDDDIAPSGGRFRLFGRKRAQEDDEDEYEDDEPDTEAASSTFELDDPQARLTDQLASAMDEDNVPRRRGRKETAQPEPAPEPEPVDEPTQSFKPLRRREAVDDGQRTRRFKPVRVVEEPEPVDEDEDDEPDDEDDIVPVRKYGRKPQRAPLRVYQDEDLDDEDDNYEDDGPYEGDDDDYDEYDEDERTMSFGKRLLRFLKGLLVIVLILLLAVITLRQLESNGRLSLAILRNTVGVLVPLDGIFPTPAPTPEPTATPEALPTAPPATPAAAVVPQVNGGATTPALPGATPETAPVATDPPSMGVALPDAPSTGATAEFVEEEEATPLPMY